MGGATKIWAKDLLSSVYFGENIIFELSKDQTFRIQCTLMNLVQILILVTHLNQKIIIFIQKITCTYDFTCMFF
jgi:hypothetical protein